MEPGSHPLDMGLASSNLSQHPQSQRTLGVSKAEVGDSRECHSEPRSKSQLICSLARELR